MSFKTTYILFGFLAFMIFIVAVAIIRTDGTDDKDTSQFVFPSTKSVRSPLKTEDIVQVEIDRKKPAEKIVLVRQPNGRWMMTQPPDYRASTTAVANLIQQLFDAKKDPKAAKNLTLEQCGLNEPTETVTLMPAEGKGKPLQLTVGEYDESKGSYAVMYVLSSDRGDKTPMAVLRSSLDSVLLPAKAFRDRDLLNPTTSDYKAVKISLPGKPTVALEKAGDNFRWRYTEPFPGDADYEGEPSRTPDAEGPNGVRSLLEDLAGLQVAYDSEKDNDFVADNVSDAGLAEFHLDPKSPQLRIEVTLAEKDNKTSKAILLIATTKKEREKDKDKDKDLGKDKNFYFARLENERNVVRLPAKGVEPLLRLLDKPDCLRERQLVTFAGGKTPDALEIKNETGTLEFFHPDPAKPWLLYRADTALSADNPTVTGLLSLLGENRKDLVYLDPKGIKDADLGLDKPAIVASFYVDGLAPPEKKEEKKDKKDEKKDDKKDGAKEEAKAVKPKLKDKVQPALKLLLVKSKKAGDSKAIVKREAGSDVSYVEVPMVLFERLNEGALGYLDKTLPPFNPGSFPAADKDVTKLVLLRDGTTFELSREAKEGAPWKIDKPTDLAGRTADNGAVNAILNTLNSLRALRLVAEKPSAEDLDKKYGLKNPTTRAVVTVTKEGKPTTFEYDFGKDDGDKQRFARQSQRDVVFVVDKSDLEPVRRDLLDLSILTFDLNKVQSLKLVGWRLPITLEVDRKGPKIWLPKVPPTAKLDEDKFERLLFDLSHLRAEKIVSRNTKPTAEQEMDVSKGALVIEITLEGGEKKPLKLTIGKQDGEAGFLAVAEGLPDIFLVSKALFQDPKSNFEYFLKK